MSISSALVSAGTGLRATARQAEAISSNVANATTPGYGRREVLLAAREYGGTGQGVAVLGVARQVDQFLIGERRLADAANSHAGAVARFLQGFEAAIGTPDSAWSLTSRINTLDTALLQAASRPDSEAALTTAIASMRELATALNGASDHVQTERMAADRAIAERVEALNLGLARVQEMNSSIAGLTAAGRDASALLDKRQVLIDELSSIIPLKEVPRANGTVALISTTGSVLLDGSAVRFEFTPVHTIVPEMTLDSGALSGLTLNGRPLTLSGPSSAIAGGELAALFTIRDEVAPLGQARLDALARDLIERFSGTDPTISTGAPGLFTDAGNALLAANEAGLAARITINPLVDDQTGGSTWRLRSGLGAVAPGPAGSADLLLALSDAISVSRPTASAALSTGSRNLPGLAAEIHIDHPSRNDRRRSLRDCGQAERTRDGPGAPLPLDRTPLGIASDGLSAVRLPAWALIAICLLFPRLASADEIRIKDLVEIDGVRGNDLLGYGLVVGLDGTGDGIRNAPFTEEIMANLLERMGVNVAGEDYRPRNVAAVMVTAALPPFARAGTRIDVTVSAIGDARSLLGGTLVMTPLNGADGQIYAVAQGTLIAGGIAAEGAAARVVQGVPTSGSIPGGARVEREVAFDFSKVGSLRLAIKSPDFTTAARIEQAINSVLGRRAAIMLDAGTVALDLDRAGLPSPAHVVARIENIVVRASTRARVVVDQRSGTIVMGEDVRIGRVAVAQGNLTLRVEEQAAVVQPNPFAEGETVVVPRTSAEIETAGAGLAELPAATSLSQVIAGLNALGVAPHDMISILKSIHAAGALHAELNIQ